MTKFVGTLNIPSLSSAPGTAQEGDVYYNTSTDQLHYYDGTSWIVVASGSVYYQTSQPSGGSYQTGDLWIDSDSFLGGPISLTDSSNSTSQTTAATANAVLQVKKDYGVLWYNSTTRIATMPHWAVTTNTRTNNSGFVSAVRITPERDITVSTISFVSVAAKSAGVTLYKFGIYTRVGTTFTLVAQTASDTTIFNAANTRYDRNLSTAGGYPATYDFVAQGEYYLAILAVGASGGTMACGTSAGTVGNAIAAPLWEIPSQTDLPATFVGSTVTGGARVYAEVS